MLSLSYIHSAAPPYSTHSPHTTATVLRPLQHRTHRIEPHTSAVQLGSHTCARVVRHHICVSDREKKPQYCTATALGESLASHTAAPHIPRVGDGRVNCWCRQPYLGPLPGAPVIGGDVAPSPPQLPVDLKYVPPAGQPPRIAPTSWPGVGEPMVSRRAWKVDVRGSNGFCPSPGFGRRFCQKGG